MGGEAGGTRVEDRRFDQLTRMMVGTRSRRRLLGLLTAILAGVGLTDTEAEEQGGIVISDASGGDGNVASGNHRLPRPGPEPGPGPGPSPCRPRTLEEACQGACKREVADGCEGRISCTCPAGEACGPGDVCCPLPRLCLPSDICCAADLVCARGGGVCCPPARVCEVGGVLNACCAAPLSCVNGECT